MSTRSGTLPAAGLLLDMDGVLVDSTGSVEVIWASWAKRRGVDPSEVLVHAHGTPSRDVVARFVDQDEVAREAAWVEGLALESEEERALPGAADLLSQTVLPVAVVTSASGELAAARLTKAGLPVPSVLVSADDVERGKPHPDPYLLAATRLGVDATACVGVEDTPAGLEAIASAGATPVGVLTSHDAEQLSRAAVLVGDLSALHVGPTGVTWQQ